MLWKWRKQKTCYHSKNNIHACIHSNYKRNGNFPHFKSSSYVLSLCASDVLHLHGNQHALSVFAIILQLVTRESCFFKRFPISILLQLMFSSNVPNWWLLVSRVLWMVNKNTSRDFNFHHIRESHIDNNVKFHTNKLKISLKYYEHRTKS